MADKIGHTPTPWHVTKRQPNVIVNDGGDKWIARATIGATKSPRFIKDRGVAEANAALIVEAVNSHELLKAQNEWLKDRLAYLQLPANSPKKIEEWLVECGMPTEGRS